MTKQLVTNLTETEGASKSVVAFVCFKDISVLLCVLKTVYRHLFAIFHKSI